MPIIRNPFRKQDENARPVLHGERPPSDDATTKPIDIKEREPVEYQLSEINDSGVYLPPSPTEKKSFWGTTSSRSTTSSSIHRCAFNENEQFNISRESFDSYRRSFDISARSPVIQPEGRSRASLDSRTYLPPPRSSNSFNRPLQVPQTQEEDRFEDVNIDDPKPQQPPKKRGIFSRMVDGGEHGDARPNSSHDKGGSAWNPFSGGRKRGQSGVGSELGAFPKREETPKPEKQGDSEPTQQLHSQAKIEDAPPEAPMPKITQAPEVRAES